MKSTIIKFSIALFAFLLVFTSCFKDDLLREIDDLRTLVVTLQQKNDSLNKVINLRADSLAKALTASQKKTDSLSVILKTKTDSLSQALGITNTNLLALSKSIDSIKTQITGINTQLTQLSSQLATTNSQIAVLTLQLASANADIVALNTKYQQLTTQLQTINAQIAALQAEQAKLLEQLNNIQAQIIVKSPPYITTLSVTFKTDNSAFCQSNLTSAGNDVLIERGICWNIYPNPTIQNSRTIDGSSLGIYNSQLSGLIPNTSYYVRSYARNSFGVSYGEEKSFTTLNLNQISDLDENVYNTVKVGNQIWMKENLKTTTFNNGDKIPYWSKTATRGYCWLNDNTTNKSKYGAIYNFYTTVDSRNVCPIGWHIPTEQDWNILFAELGGINVAADKMKDNSSLMWTSISPSANNSSGFTVLPSGNRDCASNFIGEGRIAQFASTRIDPVGLTFVTSIISSNQNATFSWHFDCNGASIRCIKN